MLFPLFFLLASCSFSHERIEEKNYGKVFAATKLNIKILSEENYILGGLKYIFILDLPFSLITDIVILPYDLYVAPEYKADIEFWDNHFSSTSTLPPNYSALSKNYSEYGANRILDKLGREYLKQHPDYAITFIKIAAENKEVERSSEILSKISNDRQIPRETMIDICTLSVSNIDEYKPIIIGFISNKSTPSSCLHQITKVFPSNELTNNRHQLSLLKTISKRLNKTGKPEDSHFAYLAEEKASEIHKIMQVRGTITSIDATTGWVTIKTTDNECIALKTLEAKAIQAGDFVSGELKESGGGKALNDTNSQSFRIYVSYRGDELESTAKKLCQ